MSPYNKGKIERMKLHKRYLYSCYYRSSILSCFVFTLNGKIDNHSERKKYQKKQIPHAQKRRIHCCRDISLSKKSITVIILIIISKSNITINMSCYWRRRLQQTSTIDMTQSSVILIYHHGSKEYSKISWHKISFNHYSLSDSRIVSRRISTEQVKIDFSG